VDIGARIEPGTFWMKRDMGHMVFGVVQRQALLGVILLLVYRSAVALQRTEEEQDTFTFRAFGRRFYPKRLTKSKGDPRRTQTNDESITDVCPITVEN